MASPAPSDLLLLADGRLPAGAHAHSGGIEQAIELGDVDGPADLAAFLAGVTQTTASTAMHVAAAACDAARQDDVPRLAQLDEEETARTPSPALRAASRTQGRQLLRAAAAIWPEPALSPLPPLPDGPHLALAQGLTAARLGFAPADAARLAAYGALTACATAAVRLLGLDPFGTHGVVARSLAEAEPTIEQAAAAASSAPTSLPASTAPHLEIGAELHRARDLRMFAS